MPQAPAGSGRDRLRNAAVGRYRPPALERQRLAGAGRRHPHGRLRPARRRGAADVPAVPAAGLCDLLAAGRAAARARWPQARSVRRRHGCSAAPRRSSPRPVAWLVAGAVDSARARRRDPHGAPDPDHLAAAAGALHPSAGERPGTAARATARPLRRTDRASSRQPKRRRDEILVVGHSVGATLAVSVLARLLDAAGAARSAARPPIALLSLGHCMPLLRR